MPHQDTITQEDHDRNRIDTLVVCYFLCTLSLVVQIFALPAYFLSWIDKTAAATMFFAGAGSSQVFGIMGALLLLTNKTTRNFFIHVFKNDRNY